MRLVAAPDVLARIREGGGRVYVWPRTARCCSSVTHTLETGTTPPAKEFRLLHATHGIEVLATPGLIEPQALHLELSRRGRLRAFWNGQAWIG